MLFNSFEFLLFFPIVVGLFFALPHRHRWLLLLIASYVFYCAWSLPYGLLLLGVSALDWWVALKVQDTATVSGRRRWLVLSLIGNLGVLFFFKYYNLVNDTFLAGADALGVSWPIPRSNLLLPLGISFHTFQSLSYTIDIYRGRFTAERHPGMYLLYVAYFPQLVAGPIERGDRLLPQLKRPVPFDWDRIASGLRLAAWGMFKKVVVADRLAVLVDAVYNEPRGFGGFALGLATLFFTYQVYCDFSGYSDVAIGVARVIGVDLMRNFDQPHGSRSMTEWWSRWHISLSTWFRDYVYIPLGGNRGSFWSWARNTTVVFMISGLWHGASWRFAAWGLMHALLVVGDRATKPVREAVVAALGLNRVPALRAAVAIGCTFVLWMATLVPFRAHSLADAVYVFTHLHVGWEHFGEAEAFGRFLDRVHFDLAMFAWCLFLMPLVEVVDWLRRSPTAEADWARLPGVVRWGLLYAVGFGVLLLGHWVDTPFVYFQF
ncbi:MAG: MBOAT family O-acyltransferase [Myxococcota bacterium]